MCIRDRGESGYEARPCDFEWVRDLRRICVENKVDFWFKQTGSKFVKDVKTYNGKRQFQHSQARKSGINLSLIHISFSFWYPFSSSGWNVAPYGVMSFR